MVVHHMMDAEMNHGVLAFQNFDTEIALTLRSARVLCRKLSTVPIQDADVTMAGVS